MKALDEMTMQELYERLRSGATFTVECTKGIDDLELWLEAGMRVALKGPASNNGDLIKLTVDASDHDTYNDTLATANYFDKNQRPVLTAKQAGYYPANHVDTVYVEPTIKVGELFREIPEASAGFALEFRKSGEANYVQWLEDQLREARETMAKTTVGGEA